MNNPKMKERISPDTFYQQQNHLTQGLIETGKMVSASGLEIPLLHLLKIRASQINGCAYCLHMHNREARLEGEQQERLDMLSAWRESPYYTARENAALAWCEALTQCSTENVSEELYQSLCKVFNEKEVINLTSIIVTINSWNRIVAAMGFIPTI